jgi:23S rRNA (adenine2503-C2)-methyltransferase
MTSLPDLVGLDREELAAALDAAGVPAAQRRMRANQLWHWIYHRGATSFEAMTTVSKELRAALAEQFRIGRPAVGRRQQSSDGTQKWLFRLDDGNLVESVYIPEEDRGALCVSSQVGCTLTCKFCHTGTQRLVRNLDAREIVQQFMSARDALGEWPSPKEGRLLTNVVMMGMGEPLYNYDEVAKALRIVMDGEGLALSKRRITLSTSGVVPMMRRCGEELGVGLAVSLHAVRDELRDVIVPINKKYPLAELLAACRDYPGASNARRITFEYVMLKGVNDSVADAKELVRLIAGIPAKVNLIPFNPWPGAPFECSERAQILQFAQVVNDAGYSSPVRWPRGRDIMAACGQLKSDSVKKSRAELLREAAA